MKNTKGYIQYEKERDEMFENESFPDMGKQYTFQDMRCAWNKGAAETFWLNFFMGAGVGGALVAIAAIISKKIM